MGMTPEDSTILSLFEARCEDAVAECERKYGGYCKAIALRILGNGEDAEECVNDTLLAAWNSIPPAKPVCFRLYLAKLARNAALHRYEKRAAEKRGGGELPAVLEELAECLSGGELPGGSRPCGGAGACRSPLSAYPPPGGNGSFSSGAAFSPSRSGTSPPASGCVKTPWRSPFPEHGKN